MGLSPIPGRRGTMPPPHPRDLLLPASLVLAGAVSVQAGAGFASRLFSQIPPAAVTTLRLWAAALILLASAGGAPPGRSPAWRSRRAWRDAGATITFGIALATMNFAIYQSFARIPLGIAVTIEFLGPLAVAVAGARRLASLAWAALAAAGVLLLAQGSSGHLNLAGVAFALVVRRGVGGLHPAQPGHRAAFLRDVGPGDRDVRGGGRWSRGRGWPRGRRGCSGRPCWPPGAAIGLLSSVIPYWLEFEALRRVPARVFGVWMSMQPAVAALIGLAMLGQRLSAAEWAGICCVVVASAAAARGGAPEAAQALRWAACLPGLRALRPRCCGRPRPPCAGSRWPR